MQRQISSETTITTMIIRQRYQTCQFLMDFTKGWMIQHMLRFHPFGNSRNDSYVGWPDGSKRHMKRKSQQTKDNKLPSRSPPLQSPITIKPAEIKLKFWIKQPYSAKKTKKENCISLYSLPRIWPLLFLVPINFIQT